MGTARRNFLKGMFGVGAAAVTLSPKNLYASVKKKLTDKHMGMLYDATLCVGCKACETSCKKANNLPIELGKDGVWDAPNDLSTKTVNIIRLFNPERDDCACVGDGEAKPEKFSYIKRQCMHCVDPNCVSGCPTTALVKEENGVVTWNGDACIGCRYCQMNCPYNIPKYEYHSMNPKIVKCQLCDQTNVPAKGEPACTEICPTNAVIYGRTKDLLREAKRRIAAKPDGYINQVYGEKEGGGTSVLYLSAVPFKFLGLPDLPEHSDASISEGIHHTIYKGMIAPAVIYAGLFFAAFRSTRNHHEEGE